MTTGSPAVNQLMRGLPTPDEGTMTTGSPAVNQSTTVTGYALEHHERLRRIETALGMNLYDAEHEAGPMSVSAVLAEQLDALSLIENHMGLVVAAWSSDPPATQATIDGVQSYIHGRIEVIEAAIGRRFLDGADETPINLPRLGIEPEAVALMAQTEQVARPTPSSIDAVGFTPPGV